MSLKAFHIFFIVMSALLCLGIGAARIQAFMASGGAGVLLQAGAAVFAGAALLVYGRRFLEKTKGLGYLTFAFLLLGPNCAVACSVCFGDPESQQGQAMKAGILVMLGIVGTVLSGFASLFLYWMSRSRRITPAQEKGVSS
jgi:hypothetical protein